MTVKQAAEKLKKQREDSAKENRKSLMDAKEAFLRYNSMLLKVEHWKVPKELESLKKFMMDQLTESIKFDCSAITRVEKEKEDKTTPSQYLKFLREDAQRDVEYHTEAYNRELKTAKSNAAWVKAIKESAKGQP
jgi:trans-aconitate methyltransferase